MIKTQVSIPDDLYLRAKEIARIKEWSLAEVFRRGLEYMDEVTPKEVNTAWELPIIECGSIVPTTAEELNRIIEEDREDYLLSKVL